MRNTIGCGRNADPALLAIFAALNERTTTEELLARIDRKRVPQHVAIIMDGNGRWAEQHGEHRMMGHANGVHSVREALTAATELGVRYLTLYAFSTENWNRPKEEVDALMDLLVGTMVKELDELSTNGVRLNAIGDLESLPESCREALQEGMDRTVKNDRITLTLALSYSSRWEILRMVRKLADKAANAALEPGSINERTIAEHLCTSGMPDPELLIRTSGEQRVSNFLLWQIAYAELWFTQVLWPDFRKEHLFQAVYDFQNRERRFGLVSEQVASK